MAAISILDAPEAIVSGDTGVGFGVSLAFGVKRIGINSLFRRIPKME
ncbi:hypothetical protein [Coleofasciculus sp. F4-SAH-05]